MLVSREDVNPPPAGHCSLSSRDGHATVVLRLFLSVYTAITVAIAKAVQEVRKQIK